MNHGIDATHDARLTSWVATANGHPNFPVQNLPYGPFSPAQASPRAGVAIGDAILDLPASAHALKLPRQSVQALAGPNLNALLALPAAHRVSLRQALSAALCDPACAELLAPMLHDASGCTLHLPAAIGDYTDFYVGIHHARTVGSLYRPDDPLTANYKYLPVGYHGRASSIRPSGTPVIRPHGQTLRPPHAEPGFGPSNEMDYELELGVWIGTGNALGEPIPIGQAAQHIAGLCLLNDWSARDFQAWERLPLGPFLGKSFQTSISPWIVTTEALAPFRTAPARRPDGDPAPLPYLQSAADSTAGQFHIILQASLLTQAMREAGLPPMLLSRSTARDMYWTVAQMVAHHSSNGCNLTAGDLLGTGTISGPDHGQAGSLFEITRGGRQPVQLPNGQTRTYLEDGDEIVLDAHAAAEGYQRIGFGVCRGTLLPAHVQTPGAPC